MNVSMTDNIAGAATPETPTTIAPSESSGKHRRASTAPLRVLIALPGLHRINRGAEVAFESVASELARRDGVSVTLIGSGPPRESTEYEFKRVRCVDRQRFERWPSMPFLRNECGYEELTFMPGLWRAYRPAEFDITVTCAYPYTNWMLRNRRAGERRPPHVFVTQNGDWPAYCDDSEFGWFDCDGLVCTNPDYHDRNSNRWFSSLIPNGVDPNRFTPDGADRDRFNLPEGARVAIMVSALIDTKRVAEGIRAASRVQDLHLIVAGDGPLRADIEKLGRSLMGDRFRRVELPREAMPDLYRAADLFLHMSQVEPSANSYLEALASGLPIVTHDRRVTRWTLEDRALLVDTDDLGAVAGAIKHALAIRTPQFIDACRELVERRFAWRSIASQYESFLREVMHRAG